MRLPSITTCALALLQSVSATAVPTCPDGLCLETRAHISNKQIAAELGRLVSKGTQVFGSDDARWANATERFQTYMPPNITLVVAPAQESDVATIVKYANRNSIPFLAVNRAHGYTITLGKFTGIQIDLSSLRNITVAKDGKSALMQGGVYVDQVINALWDAGYVANTGSCGCVGFMGPALGGGHGRYQGMYGLVSDTLVQLNVVLADGSTVVVSDKQNQDLFWAMRGAGHNFGIVTSFTAKIWPRQNWYYRNLVFTGDKLEALFEAANKLGGNGTQPKELGHYGLLTKVAAVPDPIIEWSFAYAGSKEDAAPYLDPFTAIGPIQFTDGNVTYPEVAKAQQTGIDDPICAPGLNRITATAGLQVFNITTQRQIYELYKTNINLYPELANSYVLMEQYAMEAVRAVDPASQAFPWRGDNLLLGIDIDYPAGNPSLDAPALKWAKDTVDLWNAGQPSWRKPSAYVNYAMGNEPIEQWYGYEGWRLAALRALKKKYDPNGKFNYYNPITY